MQFLLLLGFQKEAHLKQKSAAAVEEGRRRCSRLLSRRTEGVYFVPPTARAAVAGFCCG